ncbi:HAD family hydrolase [Bradyrhizobium sp.]|jgi:beta-phosphoglucomutase-like phosphatase (HAD superfamily)|uniref:HAD family hydrolase n=1 Tax=Bradyrhizobium sp. TaxID=376 RepID=UPI002DDC9A35|nr:HAD hydrolase-like protein [Bradyrhizobium sp.]HEV2160512.1 HAD hydrolase-like protein [Bradyrhizobium sp.]
MYGLACIGRRPEAAILDFDGVILRSVEIKAQAFSEIYRGEEPARIAEIMAYQHAHGGVNRREKFRYFEREVFGRVGDEGAIEMLSARYTSIVHEAVVHCPCVDGALDFIMSNFRRIALHVVSGTPENELIDITERRGLKPYFRTIVGSPVQKLEAFRRIIETSTLAADQVVAVGDSRTEQAAAEKLGIPFVGIVDYSKPNPFPNSVPVLSDLEGLADLLHL